MRTTRSHHKAFLVRNRNVTRRKTPFRTEAEAGGGGMGTGDEMLGSQGTFGLRVKEEEICFVYRLNKIPGNVSLEIERTLDGAIMEVFFDESEVQGPVDDGCGITVAVARELVEGAMTLGWGTDAGVGVLPRLQMSANQMLTSPVIRDSSWQTPI